MFNKIKAWFAKKPSRLQVLEDKIKDLEKRSFKKKKPLSISEISNQIMFSYTWGVKVEPISLEEEIMELQDKFDAMAKTLKIKIVKTQAKDSEWVAKQSKKK